MNKYYTLDRASELLGHSRTHLERLIKDHVIPLAYDIVVVAGAGRKLKLISRQELIEYAKANNIKFVE
jgi:hypothetical protein